jgi:periplasmic divalent cation tolerance protein
MTTASRDEARRISQLLLEKHLIACANILGPVESKFWWQGKTDTAKEYYVLMKSNEKLFKKLSETVKKVHSYQVPEILAVPIVKGWQPYMKWLKASLKPVLVGK